MLRETIERFRQAHLRIAEALGTADESLLEPAALYAHLKAVRADIVSHFREKDAFYPELSEALQTAGDNAGAQLARIFESNMKIQSAAVQRFFEALDRAAPAQLPQSYQTVASVIRQRLSTEEKAVFPLTVRKEPRRKP
ncbi:MAG: hemerythrin domain-containing protein [Myxococcaceae bacterium]|nr:hemerythrin domain-containing protein [Myxococcaceae bacterium]